MKFGNRFLALAAAALLLGCSATGNGLAQNETAAGSGSEETKEVKSEDLKQVKIGGIKWYVNYDAALKVAKQKNKPIWLHFGENPG